MMAHPIKQMPYELVGDLKLEFPGHGEVRDYRRELDLETAIAKVSYNWGGVHFTREVFASPVDQVIVVRLTGDHPNQIKFRCKPGDTAESRYHDSGAPTRSSCAARMEMHAGVKGALKFQARVLVLAHGGKTASREG